MVNVLQKNWQDLIKPNKLEVDAGPRPQQGGDRRRRAARARLRHDARQRAAPRAAVLAAGRGDQDRADRRRAARVLLDPQRARGRDQHHPQHQGDRAAHPLRGSEAHGAQEGRRRTGARQGHRDRLRRRDPQPRARHLHARPGRRDPHGVHRRHRQGLRAGRPQPARGRAHRPHPGRQPLQPGQEGLLQGREHPRGPDPRLRQAHHDGRDRRLGAARGCRGARRPHPAGPALGVHQLRGADQGASRSSATPSSPSTRRCSRRSTSWSCRCARRTA